MKLIKDLLKSKAPRHKKLNDALLSKKAGAHFSKKSDYKRSVEKEKMREEMKNLDESSVAAVTTTTKQGRRHKIELMLSNQELGLLLKYLEKYDGDEKIKSIIEYLKNLYIRATKS